MLTCRESRRAQQLLTRPHAAEPARNLPPGAGTPARRQRSATRRAPPPRPPPRPRPTPAAGSPRRRLRRWPRARQSRSPRRRRAPRSARSRRPSRRAWVGHRVASRHPPVGRAGRRAAGHARDRAACSAGRCGSPSAQPRACAWAPRWQRAGQPLPSLALRSSYAAHQCGQCCPAPRSPALLRSACTAQAAAGLRQAAAAAEGARAALARMEAALAAREAAAADAYERLRRQAAQLAGGAPGEGPQARAPHEPWALLSVPRCRALPPQRAAAPGGGGADSGWRAGGAVRKLPRCARARPRRLQGQRRTCRLQPARSRAHRRMLARMQSWFCLLLSGASQALPGGLPAKVLG